MKDLVIFVACHKPGKVFQDEIHVPIHVGRAVSRFMNEMSDMIGDDTGDNISEKNPYYSELTAQYWAWKNVHDVNYIGFCHYRRFFDMEINKDNIDTLMRGKDVISLKYTYYHSMYWEMIRFISLEDFTILLMVLKKKYPEYEKTMIEYLYGNVLYPKNMYICRKDIFDQYAEWLFDVLFECEKHIMTSPYNRAKRSLAYMGEYLMPVYMIHNKMKMSFVHEKEDIPHSFRRSMGLLRMALQKKAIFLFKPFIEKKPDTLEQYYLPEVLTGFENDHIKI